MNKEQYIESLNKDYTSTQSVLNYYCTEIIKKDFLIRFIPYVIDYVDVEKLIRIVNHKLGIKFVIENGKRKYY